jgi:hypothetical protein
MIRFEQYYLEYRRVGFSRLDAFRFAWLVVTAGVKPIPIRSTNRWPSARY